MAHGCPSVTANGTGLVVQPGIVLTAAHVVAGATSIDVRHGTLVTAGIIVGFDPRNDLALVAVSTDFAPSISLGTALPGQATAWVVREGNAAAMSVEIIRSVVINTEDIYREGATARPGFELRATVRPGDSGAAVVADNHVIAVVWARSRQRDDRAWAINPTASGVAIWNQLASGRIPPMIDLTRCIH